MKSRETSPSRVFCRMKRRNTHTQTHTHPLRTGMRKRMDAAKSLRSLA